MGKHAAKPKLYLRNGTYWCRYPDASGYVRRRTTGHRDLKAATMVALELARTAATPADDTRAAMTLGEACSAFLETLRTYKRSPATLRVQGQRIGHLEAVLGKGKRLASITRATLHTYWTARDKAHAAESTRTAELETLRAVLRHAAANNDYDAANIVRIWDRKLVEGGHVERHDWLSAEQVRAVLAVADDNLPHRADYLRGYLTLGVRCSELYLLRADDLKHDTQRVHVRGTKTEGADREIDVHDAYVWSMLCRRADEARGGPLFPVWSGSWVQFHKWADTAKVPRFSHNTLRRTFASLLCTDGVPLKHLANLLGHADTKMVEAIYARVAPESMRAVVARLPSFAPVPRLPADVELTT